MVGEGALTGDATVSPAAERAREPGAHLQRLATGFVFTEIPIWHSTEQVHDFADVPGDVTDWLWRRPSR